MPHAAHPGARTESLTALALCLPAFTGLVLFVVLPFGLALILSFTDLRLGSPLAVHFAGLTQYRRIFADPLFPRALLNTTVFAAVVVPLQTALALMLALALDRPLPGRTLWRALFFLPVIFPLSLVAVIWVLIFAPGAQGTMNALLGAVWGSSFVAQDYLNDARFALVAIMATSLWQGTGFQMVILLAGLQAIPRNLLEAGLLDGAGPWSRLRHITLPQLRNTLIFVIVVTTILAFRLFDQVQIMTRGGPGHATTSVMYATVETAFVRQQVARASAMSVVLFLIVLILTLMQRRIIRQDRAVT